MMNKIFLFEDDIGLLNGLVFALEKQNYKVNYVRTKEEAVELFKNDSHLVILDVLLPDGTGFEVCRHIRNISNVPIYCPIC